METDLKELVKDTYHHIIRGSLNKILLFDIDSLMNQLIRMHIENPPKADEILIATDKFSIYRKIWQGVLEMLYETYMPNIKYEFKWEVEITPYTIMLCEFTKNNFTDLEIDLLKDILHIEDEQIESDFDNLLLLIGADKIGFEHGLKGKLPENFLPRTKKEELSLIFRFVNFPPLGELAKFVELYNQNLNQQIDNLSIAFSLMRKAEIPPVNMEESLHYSFFHISHRTFQKYGIDTFINHPGLLQNKTEFEDIQHRVSANKGFFNDNFICPCCGNKQEIQLPEEVLQYKLLLENQPLCTKIGILYLEDFIEDYKNSLSERFNSFFPDINKVDNPKCLILVEGESEETAIPILAFRKRYILSMQGIQVYNSQSKEKLANDFRNFKQKYPKRKMICLLDSDAVKERNDIQRIIKNNHNKYKVICIEKGTFEDIFDIYTSIQVLNEMYTEGTPIELADFDLTKDFLLNIKKVLYKKKKAQFDKVQFSRNISLKIDIGKCPKEINEIIDTAKLFMGKSKFLISE